MIGTPIPLARLFPAQGQSDILLCEARVIGLTNTGVASYAHGKMSRMPHTGLLGSSGLEGGGVATFSDRSYDTEPDPALDRNSLRTPNDNGVQRFSTHEKDHILWRITGPHPLQASEFMANFYFGSAYFGPDQGPPMPVPLARHDNFLIGTTKPIRGGQTTFSFAFFEYPVLAP